MLIDETISKQVYHDKPIVTLSAHSIQGKRSHMEDFFDIGHKMKPLDQIKPDDNWPYDFFYLAVFDGHGGEEAAKFAKENLLNLITQQKDFWSTNDEDVMRAIRNGFARAHSTMRKIMPTWAKTNKTLPSTAGTTASILFIKNNKFYSGHVGDSRIVICQSNEKTKNWISNQITEDHKPESEVETSRILRAGGEVRSKIGVHRVVWKRPVVNYDQDAKCATRSDNLESDYIANSTSSYPFPESVVTSYQTIPFLAIARSLGDFWSINQHTGLYVVSPEPDVSCRPITPNDKCIILATDGLWNVVNSTQAVRFLQELDALKADRMGDLPESYCTVDNFYDASGDKNHHAKSLVYIAYQIWERKRLKSDNITAVVAMLHDILPNTNMSKKAYTTRTSVHSIEKYLPIVLDHPTRIVQIPRAKSFSQILKLNPKTGFAIEEAANDSEDYLAKLESYLILPPTILNNESEFRPPNIRYPRNYLRLAAAECRIILRYPTTNSSPFSRKGEIYIKNCSDDPADEVLLPIRNNSKGKSVRDASAQATQSIHDFGQPWHQLWDENKNEIRSELDDVDDAIEGMGSPIDDGTSAHIDAISVLSQKDCISVPEIESVVDEMRRIVGEESGIAKVKETEEVPLKPANECLKEEKSIPQLRCLLNHTPPLRRSSRNTYLSVSDNVKRKAQYVSSIPRRKRRKSQPVRRRLPRV